MAATLIRGGRVIDPSHHVDGVYDLLIENGKIAGINTPGPSARTKSSEPRGATVIDADGLLVTPGFIDVHTHLRQPGREDQETIETGSAAELSGGFPTVCAMPNTTPAVDHRGMVDLIHREAQRCNLVTVHPIGAMTRERQGRELTDFGELFDAGCVALSDDGNPVADGFLMRRALEYARVFGRPLIQHAEDPQLAAGGVMHEGLVATMLGLRGIPSEAESVLIARDVALAELTGGWVHFAHLSSEQSVELIRRAKARGVPVTCEATPHHLALTHEAVEGFETNAKVNPPLRTEQDRLALIEGLREGTIDCIATDHAPHTDWEKQADFDSAPFGISGLETALGVCAEALIKPGLLTWGRLIETLTANPAKIAGLESGTLGVGADADVVLIDPGAQWTVDPTQFLSKGRHSPFAGRTLTGRVVRIWRHGVEAKFG